MLKFSISYLNNGYNAEFVPRIRFVYQQKYINCLKLSKLSSSIRLVKIS